MRRALIGADPNAQLMQLIAGDDDLGNYLAVAGRWDILGDGADNPGVISDQAKQAAMAQILGRNAKLLRDVPPTSSRIFPLGFVSQGTVLPGAQAIIISRPQVIFRGERLSVPSDVAGDFTIDDVKVGKDSQFCAEGPIPARSLQENAWGVHFQLDTAQISQNIQLTVTNISGTARTFRAMLLGSVVE
jgi:hypothetical protein